MRIKLLFLALFLCSTVAGRSIQHLTSIGDFKTTGGEIIRDCKIGYRIMGTLNATNSNIILWPTWFSGTSEALLGVIPKIVDTTRFAVVIADALGDGVSSSPSNSKMFPAITIRDMVRSQYELLSRQLNINHVYAVAGISMGGMQTFEWVVAYPEFMDKAITIVGTPKQSFYDLLLWHTELELINQAENNGNAGEMELIRERIADIDLMHLYTPGFFVRTQTAGDLDTYLKRMYEEKNDLSNLRSQIQAMIHQDIYKSSGKNFPEIKELIKARLLIIVSKQDHMVNPAGATGFAKQISCEFLEVDTDCGHDLLACGSEKIIEVINSFLK